jgi:hypothetical protein
MTTRTSGCLYNGVEMTRTSGYYKNVKGGAAKM